MYQENIQGSNKKTKKRNADNFVKNKVPVGLAGATNERAKLQTNRCYHQYEHPIPIITNETAVLEICAFLRCRKSKSF